MEKTVRLQGIVPPDFQVDGERFIIDLRNEREVSEPDDGIQVTIRDARKLQANAVSLAEFFDEYGFVLLHAPTAVHDWDTELESVFYPEVKKLICKRLLPGQDITVTQMEGMAVRRGLNTEQAYAHGAHNDYGQTAADMAEMIAAYSSAPLGWAWKMMYGNPFVRRSCVFNFWRTTNMTAPLQHMPLALCKPSSVRQDDLVPTGIAGLTPTGKLTNQMSVKYHPDQEWFWYPLMTPDEVLVFKTFDLRKEDEHAPVWRNVFHTAFVDPDADEDCELRQSIDHRPQVTITTSKLSEACVIM